MHNKKRFTIYGNTESIYAIIIINVAILVSVVMFSLSFFGIHFLVFGMIFCVLWLSLVIVFAFKPFYVKFIGEDIQVTTLFGKIKKVNSLKNLTEISINYIVSIKSLSGDYFCLKFSNKVVKWENFNELIEDDKIILIKYSPVIRLAISELTKFTIIDNRVEQDTSFKN